MNHRCILSWTLSLYFFLIPAYSQVKPLKVLLLYDMEGVTGIYNVRQTDYANSDEYQEARKSLTADVNAAIVGLKSGGATEIVIVDGHGSGNSNAPDVLEDQLFAPARMHYTDSPYEIYMGSYDQSIDAIVAVGMHAGAGNQAGFLSHTYTMEDIEYKVNGIPFNESMILAAGAARYHIPLIMVSGDDQLQKEINRKLPWVKFAVVKHAVNRTLAEPVERSEASNRIEKAACGAIQKLATASLPDWGGPYRFALKFQDNRQARVASSLSETELQSDRLTVQLRANDFEEGYTISINLIRLASTIGYLDAQSAILKAQNNSEELEARISDWMIDRWLEKSPKDTTQQRLAATTKYWGAK